MMGIHHAITGAAAWVAVTSAAVELPTFGWHPLGPSSIALGAIVCAGAALLPDADHPNATIAHSLPVVGRLATSAIGRGSGGHRHGTHSVLSAVVVVFGALWLMQSGWTSAEAGTIANIVSVIAVAGLLAFALKVLTVVPKWSLAWVLGGALSLLIDRLAPTEWTWLPLCIAVGWVTHLAGDFLTTGGLPLLWPFRPRAPKGLRRMPVIGSMWSSGGRFALPILGNTGSLREWCLMIPTGLYALAGVGIAVEALLPYGWFQL
jgi:membrane-bound metal-dependent hydrolase YbcI (DUF457 family)